MLDWWGPVIWEYYGATEGGGTTATPQDWLKYPGTVGSPWAISELKITDDDGTVVEPGVPGTVWMKMGGQDFEYKGDKSKTDENHDAEGFFTVGDVGYLNEDGFLFLCDRKSDMIIAGGVNIYPAEIEGEILAHPGVGDVAVFGVPDDDMGEQIKAVIEPAPGYEAGDDLRASIMAHIEGRLAKFKWPRSIDFVDELPREPTGKLLKRQLRDPYWEGRRPSDLTGRRRSGFAVSPRGTCGGRPERSEARSEHRSDVHDGSEVGEPQEVRVVDDVLDGFGRADVVRAHVARQRGGDHRRRERRAAPAGPAVEVVGIWRSGGCGARADHLGEEPADDVDAGSARADPGAVVGERRGAVGPDGPHPHDIRERRWVGAPAGALVTGRGDDHRSLQGGAADGRRQDVHLARRVATEGEVDQVDLPGQVVDALARWRPRRLLRSWRAPSPR